MLVGKAIAGGHGLTYEGVVGTPPAVKFPPLYPAVLAVLWLALGSIGAVTGVAALLNFVFLASAAVLLAKALRDSGGMPLWAGAVAAGLAFVSSDVVRAALIPLSESLYVVLAMGALALWAGSEKEEGGRARRVRCHVPSLAHRPVNRAVGGAAAAGAARAGRLGSWNSC